MAYTREQIRAARQAWIDFLQQPERKKATGRLSLGGEARCCLGHACALFDPTKELTGWRGSGQNLPDALVEKLGMWGEGGPSGEKDSFGYRIPLRGQWQSALYQINDDTRKSPQQIGALLQGWIEGGADTPFIPLSDFPAASEETV